MIPALALFAAAWIVFRAATQSITLDEANTFLFWVNTPDASHWAPHSNNHVLNSLLMRLSVFLAGSSHLALRAPALLGGFLYIGAAYRLTHILSSGVFHRLLIFTCLVFNPFVMDYLVAARGYGLAAAFYLLALIQLLRNNPTPRSAIFVSVCTALSFSANFSTAYAVAILWLAATWRFAIQNKNPRLVPYLTLPGAAIVLALCGHALTHYDKSHLIWGADSLAKMFSQMRDSSFDRLNPHIVNPILSTPLGLIPQIIPWLILSALCVAHIRNRDFQPRLIAALLLIPLFLHWLQFQFFRVLLPYERTSLIFVVLLTLAVAALRSSRLTNTALALAALYFVGTLRHHYFNEWSINADIRASYPILLEESVRLRTREIISDLNYTPSLNVYRILYATSAFDEIPNHGRPLPGRSIYVLPADQFKEFTQREGLTLRYRSPLSDYSIWLRDPTPR